MALKAEEPVVFSTWYEADQFFQSYQRETVSRWRKVVSKLHLDVSAEDFLKSLSPKNHVRWFTNNIPFNGTPFYVIGYDEYDCHRGPDRDTETKKRAKEARELKRMTDHTFCNVVKSRRIVQDTKKVNCPAQITLTRIVQFPDYRAKNNEWEKRNKSKDLRSAIKPECQFEEAFYLTLPSENCHMGHLTKGVDEHFGFAAKAMLANLMSQPVDPVIVNKIKELYRHNMRKASLIETYIHLFVKDDVFKGKECPSRLNRRWFPTLKDIKNIATCQSKNPNDQVNLADYVNQQKAVNPEDLIFFRASSLGENQKVNFLFVYQTKWQRRLLKRYGNHITLMDATYRTSRYAMPLFFICVKTNVNFTVVASFLVETENQESIMEALAIIKKYSPEWDPEHMMVDYSMSEINALEASFPETKILLCDFHREKSWKEWVSKIQNGVSGCQEECLGILRALAHSPTVTDYKETLAQFKSSDLWKYNPKFRTYFSNHWECRAEKWVKAYRGTLLIPVNSNNGLERQNLALKDSYLQGFKNCTIEALVKVLVEMFIPNSFVRYQQLNIRCSAEKRQYSQEVPTFLHNRPVQFVRHIMDRWTTFNISNVKRLSSNHFKAKNDDQTEYNISLDPCCCECPDFCQHKIPCKHLCAVLKFPGVSWSSLGSIFNSNPAYLLDEDVIDQSPVSYSDEISTVTSEPPPLTSESHPTETDVIINDLPKRKKNVAKEQSICISLAKELLDSLYQIDSLQDLQHIRKQIGMVLEEAKGAIPHEYGLPKKPKSPRKKPKVSPKTKIGSLPQRQKKLQLMKRVGKGAEIARRKRGLSDLNLSQAAKPSAVPPIKKVCVEAKKQESPSSPKAQNKIKIHLNRYAVPSQNTNVTLGKYKSHHITYDSITSINGMLADEVIDSYLDIMISNSGKKVFHVSLHVMSRIVYDGDMTYFSKKDLREYDIIVGVCIRRGHYSVLYCGRKEGKYTFVNSLGETGQEKDTITRNWGTFSKRKEIGCQFVTIDHEKQLDGYTCGLWCIHAVEHLLEYGLNRTPKICQPDFLRLRLNIATLILRNIVVADKRHLELRPVGQKIKLTMSQSNT